MKSKDLVKKIANAGASALLAATTMNLIAEEKPEISFDVSTTLASRYVGTSGPIIGTGPVNQTYVSANIGKNFSLWTWSNYDFGDKALHELEFGLTGYKELVEIREGFFKGKINTFLSLQQWNWPSGLLGEHSDYVFDSHLTYMGPFTLDARYTHILTEGIAWEDNRLELKLSKTFSKKHKGLNYYIIPSIHTAYHNGFYGFEEWAQVSPGLALGLGKKNWSIGAYVKHQISLDKRFEEITHGGITFTWHFSGGK